MLESFNKIFMRECRYIKANPRTLVLFFIVPIITTLIIGFTFSNQTFDHLRLGIVDYSHSSASRELINGFDQSSIFDVRGYYPTENAIKEAFIKGELDGVLVIPPQFARKLKRSEGAEVLIGANASNLGIGATMMVKGSEIISTVSTQIAVKNLVAGGDTVDKALGQVMPISFSIRPWYNPTSNISHFLIIGLIVVAVYQVLFYFTAASIIREKTDDTWAEVFELERSAFCTVVAKICPYIILAMLSWTACYMIGIYGFATPMLGSWWVWFVFSFIFIVCVASVGAFVSAFAPTIVWATSVSITLTAPALLMGGYMWPKIAMTGFYKIFGLVFPLTYFATSVRNIALVGCGFDSLRQNMMIMAAITLVALVLATLIYWLKSKRIKACYQENK